VTEALTAAADQAIPKLKVVERSKPWWTPELAALRRTQQRAFRLAKGAREYSPLQEAWKTARNAYFHAIRQAKIQHWQAFLAGAQGREVFLAHRYTKGSTVTKIPSIRYTENGNLVTADTFGAKCTAFLTTLFPTPPAPLGPSGPSGPSGPTAPGPQISTAAPARPGSSLQPQSPTRSVSKATGGSQATVGNPQPQKSTSSASKAQGDLQGWDWPALEDSEIQHALFSTRPNKAPGPDQLAYILLQRAYNAHPATFNGLYKTLFTAGYHPTCWRTGIGIILPKANKPDYSSPKAYRVITLLNY
jgi:hypothetical protein